MANLQLNTAPAGLTGILVPGDGATLTALSDSGNWPATTTLRVQPSAGAEQAFTATVVGTLATWTLTVAQVTALTGTRTTGSLEARITHGSGDLLRPVAAGRLSILSKWTGVRSPQSLGTVVVGPAGPGVTSATVDINGDLILTLDNSDTLTPVTVTLPALTAAAATATSQAGVASGHAATATSQAGVATTKAGEAASSAASVAATYRPASLVGGGNFTALSGYWGAQGGTAVASGGIDTVTGDGTTSGIGAYSVTANRFAADQTHVYYVAATVGTPDAGATSLQVMLSDWTTNAYLDGRVAYISNPTAGRDYELYGLVAIPSALHGIQVNTHARVYWATAGAANGMRARISNVIVIDLTAVWGAGNEPTATTVHHLIRTLSAGYVGTTPAVTLQAAPSTKLVVRDRKVPVQRRLRSTAAGPLVMFRFDDGYRGALAIAAPILAAVGGRGVLYANTGLLGTIVNDLEMLTSAEMVALHNDYGWEIGAHTRTHADYGSTALATWVDEVKGSISDIVAAGLPYPRSFAYPNGTRAATGDRWVYKLFDNCGITGGPERLPWRWDQPQFFHGWCTIDSSVDKKAADLAAAKRYVASQFQRGYHAILGFHGITPGSATPTQTFHLDETTFAALVQWVYDQGFPIGTPSDLTPHNMVSDANFAENVVATQSVKGHPWMVSSDVGWSRQASAGRAAGTYCMVLDSAGSLIPAGTPQGFEQRIGAQPLTEYRITLNVYMPTFVAGAVEVNVWHLNAVGDQLAGGSTGIITLTAGNSAATSYTGTYTTPAGCYGARLQVRSSGTDGFNGVCIIGHVQHIPSALYNPLA